MNNNDKNKALIFLKRTIILYVLESIIMAILFIIA